MATGNQLGNPVPSFVVGPLAEATSPQGGSSPAEPLIHPAANAIQASEPVPPSGAALTSSSPATGPVQQIVLRIARPDAQPVDLQISQHAGEVNVAVRTPDTGLQSSLRQDLGTLVGSLERAGYQAETFVPHSAATPAAIATEANSNGDHQESPSNSGGRVGSGDSQSGRQQQQGQRQQRQQNWLKELEKQS